MSLIRFSSFPFVLLAALLLGASAARAELPYLALGDSITTGYQPGGTHLTDDAFTSLVASRLDLALDNRAEDGNTAAGIAVQLQGGALDSAIASASLLTMTVGGNDMIAAFYAEVAAQYNASSSPAIAASEVPVILSNSSDSRYFAALMAAYSVVTSGTFTQSASFTAALASFTVNFTNAVAYLRRVNPSAPLVVETQYNPYQWLGSDTVSAALSSTFDAGVQKLNAVIAAPANGAGSAYRVADVYTAFAASSANLCCATGTANLDFHPNVAGHAVIAETMLEALDLVPSLTVNGAVVSAVGGGAAWAYADGTNLTLSGAGPYVISGSNGTHVVSIRAAANCEVVASNLTVDVSAFVDATAFDCGAHAVSFALAGTNTFKSGSSRAGIRTTDGALSVTNLNEEAALFATGGNWGAGIGGGYVAATKTGAPGGGVRISGGRIRAVGGIYAAGIGGGDGLMANSGGAGGTVEISGGRLDAIAGSNEGSTTDGGAGIGGGDGGAGGTVRILGGTVTAKGMGKSADIGNGARAAGGVNTFTGGSICLANGSIAPAPSNGTARVWCVTSGGFTANAPVLLDLSGSYGTDGLVADASGNLYLWLPAGDYMEGGSSAAATFLKGFGVSATGAVTGPTNAALTITGFSLEAGVTNWSPRALSAAHVETVYATNLTGAAAWSADRPTNAPALFMKLRVR